MLNLTPGLTSFVIIVGLLTVTLIVGRIASAVETIRVARWTGENPAPSRQVPTTEKED